MRINFNAVAMWAFAGCVGYLVHDMRGALIGVTVGLGISTLCTLIE